MTISGGADGLAGLSAVAAVEAIAKGKATAEDLVGACLERVSQNDPTLKAWSHVAIEAALEAARRLDRGPRRGPLHGLPIGIKDVIETADMPTAYGAPYYANWRPAADAACVAALRRAGAIVLGKTATPELACGGACPTANPVNPAHTVGGSSGGSAAAVASHMVPFAMGTQTGGSLIRPASYNGIFALKPSFGALSVAGCKYFNGSFDTLGLMAREIGDIALVWRALLDLPLPPPLERATAPRFGVCRTPWWVEAEASSRDALAAAAAAVVAAGGSATPLELPSLFETIPSVHKRIQAYEAAQSYAFEYERFGDRVGVEVRGLIEQGRRIAYGEYRALLETAAQARAQMDMVFADIDVILAPSATGEAPRGHAYLGNSVFNRTWTLLHVPCLNVPTAKGPGGLLVGVQWITKRGEDDRLLAIAEWFIRRSA